MLWQGKIPKFVIEGQSLDEASFFAAFQEDPTPAGANTAMTPQGSSNSVNTQSGTLFGGVERLSEPFAEAEAT